MISFRPCVIETSIRNPHILFVCQWWQQRSQFHKTSSLNHVKLEIGQGSIKLGFQVYVNTVEGSLFQHKIISYPPPPQNLMMI